MVNIISYILKNINIIGDTIKNLKFDKNPTQKKFIMQIKNSDENLEFHFKGRGSFGMVFQIINNTNSEETIKRGDSIILKLMLKKGTDELDKCETIKQRMDSIEKNIRNNSKSKIKADLIKKYTTKIIDIKRINDYDLIFLEYIDGMDLKDLLDNELLDDNQLNILYLKCLIAVKVFHKLLNFSHRDLKLENLFYDKENNTIKVIDYGFACSRDDKDCFNKYQGTSKYIHMKMNKKYYSNNSKKNNRNRRNINNNSGISTFSSNIKTKKKSHNYPDSVSQDLFSLIIILLKLYYHNKNSNKNILFTIIEEYNNNFKKSNNKKLEKRDRYLNKQKLINSLMELESDFTDNKIVLIIINILRKYWDTTTNEFTVNNMTGDSISSFIYDMIIYSIMGTIDVDDNNEINLLTNEWRYIIKL